MPGPSLMGRLTAVTDTNPHERLAAILDHYLDDPKRPEAAKDKLLSILNRYAGFSREEQLIRFCDDIHAVAPVPLLQVIHESERDLQIKYLPHVLQAWVEIRSDQVQDDTQYGVKDEDIVRQLLSELGYPRPAPVAGGFLSLLADVEQEQQILSTVDSPREIVRHSSRLLRVGRNILRMLLCFYGQLAFQDQYLKEFAKLCRPKRRSRPNFLSALSLDELRILLQKFETFLRGSQELAYQFDYYFGRISLLPPEYHSSIKQACRLKRRCPLFEPRQSRIALEHFEELRITMISLTGIASSLLSLKTLYDGVFPQLICIRSQVIGELGDVHLYFSTDNPDEADVVHLLASSVPQDIVPGTRLLYYPWIREFSDADPPYLRRRKPIDDNPLIFRPDPDLFDYVDNPDRDELEHERDSNTRLLRAKLEAYESKPHRFGKVYLQARYPAPYNELMEITKGEVFDQKSFCDLLNRDSIRKRESHLIEFKASVYSYPYIGDDMPLGVFHPQPILRAVAAFANSTAIDEITGGILLIGVPDDPDNQNDKHLARLMREELAKPARENDIVSKIIKTIRNRHGKIHCIPPVKCSSYLIPAERLRYEGGSILMILIPQQFIEDGPVRVAGTVYRRDYGASPVASEEWVSRWKDQQREFRSILFGGQL